MSAEDCGEPWNRHGCEVRTRNGRTVVEIGAHSALRPGDLDRIADCVSAMKGLHPEHLAEVLGAAQELAEEVFEERGATPAWRALTNGLAKLKGEAWQTRRS